jgi:Rhodopirellula transposase DDE domain
MEHDTAGDPASGIKWARRTTEKIADELRSGGIDVSPNTVAGLLRQLGFRLRVNHKKLARSRDPSRDAQFAYIAGRIPAGHLLPRRQTVCRLHVGDEVDAGDLGFSPSE